MILVMAYEGGERERERERERIYVCVYIYKTKIQSLQSPGKV